MVSKKRQIYKGKKGGFDPQGLIVEIQGQELPRPVKKFFAGVIKKMTGADMLPKGVAFLDCVLNHNPEAGFFVEMKTLIGLEGKNGTKNHLSADRKRDRKNPRGL